MPEATGTSASSTFQSSFIDPNDERFTKDYQTAPCPKSPQASHMYEIGLEKKALEHDACSSTFIAAKHVGECHICKVPITCHQRFCKPCAAKIAAKRFQQMTSRSSFRAIESAASQPDKFTYLELRIPCHPTSECIATVNSSIGPRLRKLAGGRAPAWWNAYGYKNGYLLVRVIYWGTPLTSQQFRSLEWYFTVTDRPREHLKLALSQMLVPFLPDSPRALAELEKMFDGVRQIHTQDMKIPGELIPQGVERKTCGNNSDEDDPDPDAPEPKKVKLCPICGHLVAKYSERLPNGATKQQILAARYFDV
jgi:hypothetical protein